MPLSQINHANKRVPGVEFYITFVIVHNMLQNAMLDWSQQNHYNDVVYALVNTLRPRQNGRRCFQCIFLNQNVWSLLKISLKFVPRGPITNIPSLVQIMAWRRPGHKPLSKPMMVKCTTHICVTRPQWVKASETPTNKLFVQRFVQVDWIKNQSFALLTCCEWNPPVTDGFP